MNLTEELDKKRAGAPDFISADHLKAMGGATRDLRSTGIVDQALSEGSQAPAFALPNGHGETIDVGALMERGAVVLNFYRGGWCPYCNLELKAYQARLGEMRGLGAELVAISPETPDKAALTEAREKVDFEVLSDAGNAVARQFGLVFELPADIYDIYTNTFGFDIEDLKNFVVSNQLRGIDRIVPIGRSLDMDVVWDGYDIINHLSRIVDIY